MDKRLLLFPLFLLLSACVTTGGASSGSSSGALTDEEIRGLSAITAFEAVQLARPRWLNRRSSPSIRDPGFIFPAVYVDGLHVGDIDELHRILAREVERIEFLSPMDATNRFGTDHAGGAILVTTYRGLGPL